MAALSHFPDLNQPAVHRLLHGQVVRSGTVCRHDRNDGNMFVDLNLSECQSFQIHFDRCFHGQYLPSFGIDFIGLVLIVQCHNDNRMSHYFTLGDFLFFKRTISDRIIPEPEELGQSLIKGIKELKGIKGDGSIF